MTHTPGPWTATPSPHDKRVYLIDSKANGAVGELVYVDTRKAADAQLIAASPDLLEACRAFSDYVHMEQSSTDGAVAYSNTQIHRLVFMAREAICKATGAPA